MNFRYRLMQFMTGRNGPDALTYSTLVLSLLLSFVNIILRFFTSSLITAIVQLLVYILLGYVVFRLLSRNIYARKKENDWFMARLNILKRKMEIRNQQKADMCHIYKKCPKCKAVLRLPHRIGKHKTVCPRCSNEFTVRVRK